MSAATGLSDPAILSELQKLGFTPETVELLPLVPLVETAWAAGGVTDAERDLVLQLARSRGIAPGSAADHQLGGWLNERPEPDVFTHATRLISAMLDAQPQTSFNTDDLIRYCEAIAAASGGLFGVGRVSADERSTLERIAASLKRRT